MDHPFRGAAFGGFNRQDVLTYLENTAREAAQQREALEQQSVSYTHLTLPTIRLV